MTTTGTTQHTYSLWYGSIHDGQLGKRKAPWTRVMTSSAAQHWRDHGYIVTLVQS